MSEWRVAFSSVTAATSKAPVVVCRFARRSTSKSSRPQEWICGSVHLKATGGCQLAFCGVSYRRVISGQPKSAVLDTVARLVAETLTDFVFLNQVALAPLAEKMRKRVPSACKIILLSHGLESTGSAPPHPAASPFPTERAGAAESLRWPSVKQSSVKIPAERILILSALSRLSMPISSSGWVLPASAGCRALSSQHRWNGAPSGRA